MAYSTDFSDAARRNWQAAKTLDGIDPQCRRDVAGYLYGIAAECALKQILRRSRPGIEPEHVHFPQLMTVLRDGAVGRHAGVLRRFVEHGSFMSEWDIKMRYAHRRDISADQVKRWAAHAKAALAEMEQCG